MSTTNYRTTRSALATDRQKAFLRTLLAERVCDDFSVIDFDSLSSHRAHNLIDVLMARPRIAAPATTGSLIEDPTVPAGHYALHIEGDANDVSFFEVDCPTEGRWAGRVFVSQLASDTRYPVRGARRAMVLAKIAEDHRAAGLRYGQLIGRCCRCHRTLTDDESRAAGIGPDCAGRF